MNKKVLEELAEYGRKLEEHYHDMMDIEFTVEHGKLFLLSTSIGKRTQSANLKIVLSMFCEGKMSVEDVITKIPYQHLEDFLDEEKIVDTDRLDMLGKGLGVSPGIEAAAVCFSTEEAENKIKEKKAYILCKTDISTEDCGVIGTKYCRGLMTARGGMISHGAVICRAIGKPCVAGYGDFGEMKKAILASGNEITIDGHNGNIYAGLGSAVKNNHNAAETKLLYKLLALSIKNNIIISEKAPLVWRLWNVVALKKRYRGTENTKRIVVKENYDYISFKSPSGNEIKDIYARLQYVENVHLLVEDLVEFLISQLSAQVSLGKHYLYMRPLLDPMDTLEYRPNHGQRCASDPAGMQLTGVEFFHVNRYVDFLLDIYSIKIYFCTEFMECPQDEYFENHQEEVREPIYKPLNYLDFTNPHGEGLIINTYNARGAAVYINDVLIPADKLMCVYHLLRRRRYHWTWYEDNNVSPKEISNYLQSNSFCENNKSKLYYLCEEMQLIDAGKLTKAGVSLAGGDNMEGNREINYILDEVIARGYNDNSQECNDYLVLLQRNEFKDLIALELYEYYFWNERHEFDLQLLKEMVNTVADYFANPDVIQQIESGFLQNFPVAIIIPVVKTIWSKLKKLREEIEEMPEEENPWLQIGKNAEKLRNEFSNHDYILTSDIEQIFGTSREDILPLLKVGGCKCFIRKERSIWIKPGVKEQRIKEILKEHKFKYKT